MEWTDTGVILAAKPHSENNVIVELLTRTRGRHMGLVRGGRSRRQRPALQIGNVVTAEWRARLSEHLGTFKIELLTPYAASTMEDKLSLAGLNSLSALARLLPERDPHTGLFDAFLLILDHLHKETIWPGLLVRWELELLNDLGFGLDLNECASSGIKENLIYVSPKSGRAVSAQAGEPYKNRLLPLAHFLTSKGNGNSTIKLQDILDGFALTGFFLERYILLPRGLEMPEARARLIHYLSTE